MRYGLEKDNPETLADIAKHLKISRERVRQIEQRALRKLRQKALELGLIEEEHKTHKAVKFYSGMEVKETTDILGNKIAKSPLAKLVRKAKKRAELAMAKKKNKKRNKR